MAASTALPNTTNPAALAFVVANVVLALLMIVIVGLRFLARLRFSGLGWADDVFLFLGSLCALLLVAMQISAYCMGIVQNNNLEQTAVTLESSHISMGYTKNMLRLTFVINIIYIFGLGASKISVLLFLLCALASRPSRLLCQTAIVITAAWTAAFGLVVVFMCTPVAFQWDLSLDGECGNRIDIYKSLIFSNIALGLAIMLLPSYEIWHLKTSRVEQVGLAVTFALGFGAVIVSCLRLKTVDTFYFLTALEVVLSVAAVSIPMLKSLYCPRGGRCDQCNDNAKEVFWAGPGRGCERKTQAAEKGITVEIEFVLSSYRTSN